MNSVRILIIEDDRDFAETLGDALELEGHHVRIALSGEGGLEAFAEERFELTFMDVKLPGMNGVDSFFAIREVDPEAKVVIMTGYTERPLIERARDGGVWQVMQKPMSIERVLELIRISTEA